MGGTCEQNEYKRIPKQTAKRTKINCTSNEEMGEKYGTVTGHLP
jgi:hypothetical protein